MTTWSNNPGAVLIDASYQLIQGVIIAVIQDGFKEYSSTQLLEIVTLRLCALPGSKQHQFHQPWPNIADRLRN